MDLAVCVLGGASPVQELPVLASPLVPEFLSVHASNTVKVRLVDPEEAKAIHLPVTWWGRVPFRRQVLKGWWVLGSRQHVDHTSDPGHDLGAGGGS